MADSSDFHVRTDHSSFRCMMQFKVITKLDKVSHCCWLRKNVKDLMKLRAWAEEGSFRSAIKVSQGNHFLKSLVSQFEKIVLQR